MVSEPVIKKYTDVLAILIPHTNRLTKKTVTIMLRSTEKKTNKTQGEIKKISYDYTVKYMKSSSPDDSSVIQHAIIPTLPTSPPSPPLPLSQDILLLFKSRSLVIPPGISVSR